VLTLAWREFVRIPQAAIAYNQVKLQAIALTVTSLNNTSFSI
jgi:hypothetical protein